MDGSSNSLCHGKFCSLVRDYEVPEQGVIRDHFFTYLCEHGADNELGILINTKQEILQNETCRFCCFVAGRIEKSHYAEASGVSECYVKLQFGEDFWLQILMPGQTEAKLLMTFTERIVLVTPHDRASARDGRFYNEDRVDLSMITRWLQLCNENHQRICPATDNMRTTREDAPETLRVYDVQADCLVDIAWTTHYAALSYVWGDAQPPKLYQQDLQHVYTVRSLSTHRQTMPNTIRDSMTLTAGLGLRYLWFDSLCLVQDNPADLKRGISNMDIVYEGAYITIVAANGSSADAGLPGIDQTPRAIKQETHIIRPGLEIMSVMSLDDHLNNSVWASRGWTLQEHYLSRRMINFVNGKAYFRCRQRIWCEELWTDQSPSLQDSGEWVTNLVALARESMDLDESVTAPHYYLFLALDRFQERTLTDSNDAINAMTGVLQRVKQKANTEIISGLPTDLLPLALTFIDVNQHSSTRRQKFPSWSWAGWTGHPSWEAFMMLRLEEHPNELNHALDLTCASIHQYDDTHPTGTGMRKTLWLPQGFVISRSEPYFFSPQQVDYKAADLRPETPLIQRDYELLVIVAVTLYFNPKSVTVDPEDASPSVKIIHLTGEDGGLAGYIFLDADTGSLTDELLGVFLLSKCFGTPPDFPGLEPDTSEGAGGSGEEHGDEDGEGEKGETMFWAMLITRMPNGVYERRGLGQVYQRCINQSCKPGPRWQKMVLG